MKREIIAYQQCRSIKPTLKYKLHAAET